MAGNTLRQMIDSRILGERLRQVRTLLGITQMQLASSTGMSQPTISRLENGEEVYASVLMSVLHYYQGRINLDSLFATDFKAEKEYLLSNSYEERRRNLLRQLDIMADIINEANETCLSQIALMKKIP
jgi:transcriptional regulator with XRE-family HTH domain